MEGARPQPPASSDPDAATPQFSETRWSLVLASAQSEVPGAQDALAFLCRTYWPPAYAYVRRRGYPVHDAQDLTQGFFLHLIESKTLAHADPNRGRFRSFLITCLTHYLSDAWAHARAQKRGGGKALLSLDELRSEEGGGYEPPSPDAPHLTPERTFDLRWARVLTRQALDQLAEQMAAKGRASLFATLQGFLTGHHAAGSAGTSYEAAAAQLGWSIGGVRATVHRLRREYGRLLRREVEKTVSSPQEVDEEVRYLLTILAEQQAGGPEPV